MALLERGLHLLAGLVPGFFRSILRLFRHHLSDALCDGWFQPNDIGSEIVSSDLVEKRACQIQLPAKLLQCHHVRPVPQNLSNLFFIQKQKLPLLVRPGSLVIQIQKIVKQILLIPVPQIQRQGCKAVLIPFPNPPIPRFDESADIKLGGCVRLDKRHSCLCLIPCLIDQTQREIDIHQKRWQLQGCSRGGNILFLQLLPDFRSVCRVKCIHIADRETSVPSSPSRDLLDRLGIQLHFLAIDMFDRIPEDDPLYVVVLADRNGICRDKTVRVAALELPRLLHFHFVGKFSIDNGRIHPFFLKPGRHLIGAQP